MIGLVDPGLFKGAWIPVPLLSLYLSSVDLL